MQNSPLPYANIVFPLLFAIMALYGAYLLIRNIILIRKGLRTHAVIYQPSSFFTTTKVKFLVGNQLIDIRYRGFSSHEWEPDSRTAVILYHPNHPSLLVEETFHCLYLWPCLLLFMGLSSLTMVL